MDLFIVLAGEKNEEIKIQGCKNSNDIIGNYDIGGIVGEIAMGDGGKVRLQSCTNSGNIRGQYGYIAGILGKVNTNGLANRNKEVKISNCSNTGSVSSQHTNDESGLVGEILGHNIDDNTIIDGNIEEIDYNDNYDDYSNIDDENSTSIVSSEVNKNTSIRASVVGRRTEQLLIDTINSKTTWTTEIKEIALKIVPTLMKMQDEYDIDPLVPLAIFQSESGMGTKYLDKGDAKYRLSNTSKWTGQIGVVGITNSGFGYYGSYEDAAYDWGNYVRNRFKNEFPTNIETWIDLQEFYNYSSIFENCANLNDPYYSSGICIYKNLLNVYNNL